MKTLALLFLLSTISIAAEPQWCRYPEISPDGRQIAFSYMGDIYLVASTGGQARQLTRDPALDSRPCWSPDGREIAFASDRNGNFDIYLISSHGGNSRRLSWHSAMDIPCGWTTDGKAILFSSARTDAVDCRLFPASYLPELYQIGRTGGQPRLISTTPMNDVSQNSNGAMIYQDQKAMEDSFRKHQLSSVARDIWIRDLDGQHRRVTNDISDDREPCWNPTGDGFYFLSERQDNLNVFSKTQAGQVKQLSFHEKYPVRSLSVSNSGLLCYTQDGLLWTLRAGSSPQKLDIQLQAERNAVNPQTIFLNGEASEMQVSPDSKEIAFIARGEVFVCSAEFGNTRRITNTPQQERSVSFSADGRSLVYAAERNGSWNIYSTILTDPAELHFYSATALDEKVIIESNEDTFQPRFSPDGKEIAFLAKRTELRVIKLKTKNVRTVVSDKYNYSYSDGDQFYDWSPDGKWFTLHFLDHGRWMDEIGLVSAKGGVVHNLSESGYSDSNPQWTSDGSAIFFVSNRNGLRSHGSWGGQSDVYAFFPSREKWDLFNLSSEEYSEAFGEDDENENDDKKENPEKKLEQKLPEVKVELDGIEERLTRLTMTSSDLSDAAFDPKKAKLYTLMRFEDDVDLWVSDLRKGEMHRLAELGIRDGSLELNLEERVAHVLSSTGDMFSISLDEGEVKSVNYEAEMTLHAANEWEYFFEHIWRQVREKFYVESLHNAEWDELKQHYSGYLNHIDTRADFAECMSEMLGELNASHTGCFTRNRDKNADATAELGLLMEFSENPVGYRILEVLRGGPFDKASSRLKAGMFITEIDGVIPGAEVNIWNLLNRKSSGKLRVQIRSAKGKRAESWYEVIKPLSSYASRALLYKRWWKRNAALVDSLSGGRLGYVHIKEMNDKSYRHVYHEVLGRYADREAIVIDSRHNGGGWLTDDLVTFFSGRRTFRDVVRPHSKQVGEEPYDRWNRRSILLMNESNYSDAHLFPFSYRDNGVGKLVGMPVAGTGTAVWWEGLMDGKTVFGIPEVGLLDERGNFLENQQLEPDFKVLNTPESLAAGRDLQIEKAVYELLKELDEND
jgi:tricorn protease